MGWSSKYRGLNRPPAVAKAPHFAAAPGQSARRPEARGSPSWKRRPAGVNEPTKVAGEVGLVTLTNYMDVSEK